MTANTLVCAPKSTAVWAQGFQAKRSGLQGALPPPPRILVPGQFWCPLRPFNLVPGKALSNYWLNPFSLTGVYLALDNLAISS